MAHFDRTGGSKPPGLFTECSILARDLSWDWLRDAMESFHVGDQILVRILSIKIRSLEDISVRADVKSVNGNTSKTNLGKHKIQGKYAGTVTDIHKGTVFVRLQIGVSAIAHSCYDNRMPGKKDDVSFVVTRINEERKRPALTYTGLPSTLSISICHTLIYFFFFFVKMFRINIMNPTGN